MKAKSIAYRYWKTLVVVIFLIVGYVVGRYNSRSSIENPIYTLSRFQNDEGKYGYRNSLGEVVILPQYDEAYYFREGLSVVKQSGLWGAISYDGKLRIPMIYHYLEPFECGLAMAVVDGRYGYIDHMGQWRIAPVYEEAKSFSEGRAGVLKDGKWGFINSEGKVVIPFQYEWVWGFNEGRARVKIPERPNRTLVIDHNGAVVTDSHLVVEDYSDGLAQIVIGNGVGFINHYGEIAISGNYHMGIPFNEGRARMVTFDGRVVLIDVRGDIVKQIR